MITETPQIKNRSPGEPTGIHLDVISNDREFDAIEHEWNRLLEEAGGTVFQTYDWNRIWWKHFGCSQRLNLIVIYDQNRPVAIAPFFRDSISITGISLHVTLRLLGSNLRCSARGGVPTVYPLGDYLDIVVLKGYERVVSKKLSEYIRRNRFSLHELLLEALPEDSFVLSHLLAELTSAGFRAASNKKHDHLMVRLDDTWQGFISGLSKNRRSHIRRSLKKISEGDHKIFRIEDLTNEHDVSRHFDELVQLHQERWNRIGFLGAFAGKINYSFQKEVNERFLRKGWLQLRRLTPLDEPDRTVAIDLNYKYKKRLYGIYCAVDEQSAHFCKGPGSTLLYATLKEGSENGCKLYDFLSGKESYKQSVSNHSISSYTVVVGISVGAYGVPSGWVKKLMYRKRQLIRKRAQLRVLLHTHKSGTALFEFAKWQFIRLREQISSDK